ncbi:MAG: hypothetical protein KGJ23_15280 [Euryarchaeota archaeon]|nr:hypothetical protein [Euryarchaeota archaeon]MDE2046400.1 hypothetical protein [Thermoplasmata archaeon]
MEEEGATFCVQCGATSPPFLGALCLSCFTARTPLVVLPPYIDVVLCSTCGSRQVGNHWEKVRSDRPEEVRRSDLERSLSVTQPARLRRVSWEVSGHNPRLREVEAKVVVEVEGQEVEVPARTEVHIILHSCPDCSRRGGRYFTARIQLRAAEEGSPRDLREFKSWAYELWQAHLRACSEKQREAVSREEELKEGWDIFFADTAAARAVARSFKERVGASAKETASLWGMKNGREVHRLTFLLRLPPVAVGDHLEDAGHLWEVSSVGSKGTIDLVDVQEGGHRKLERAEVARMRLVSGPRGRQPLPLVFPAQGPPFARDPTSGESLPLHGVLPPPPSPEEGVQEGREPSRYPLVLGEKEAWWAPHGGGRGREDRRNSKG